jgi:NitT/TauT family transport system permease protein
MKRWLFSILAICLACASWEYLGRISIPVRLLLSRPTLILDYTAQNASLLATASVYTLAESILGLMIAIIFTFCIMFVCFYFPRLLRLILPVMVVSQVIPLITLAPLFILALGLGIGSKIAMAVLLCFFPLFVNFASGYVAIPRPINELTYIYAAPNWFRILHVNIPLSLPHIFAGLKISATLSVIGAIVAEFNGADFGLGKNLFLAAKRLDPELMMASIFISSLIGAALYGTVTSIERRIGHWYLP